MDIRVPLRERVLAAALSTPSLTRQQGRRLALLGTAISCATALGLYAVAGGLVRAPPPDGPRLAGGWALAAAGLAWTVLGRPRWKLLRSSPFLIAATWASPVALLLWVPRFPAGPGDALVSGAGCFGLGLAFAAAPLATCLATLGGAEPDRPWVVGAAVGAVCGAVAEVLTLLFCPAGGPAHALVAHVLPLCVLSALGGIAGRGVLGYPRMRKRKGRTGQRPLETPGAGAAEGVDDAPRPATAR